MKVYFDDSNFMEDLAKVMQGCDRWDKPLIVLPTERDVRTARKEFPDFHGAFISFDYWYSKKWIADDDYEHIDFFRVDNVLKIKSYGVRTGCMTVLRTMKKPEDKEEA